jgi:hypothetical protein
MKTLKYFKISKSNIEGLLVREVTVPIKEELATMSAIVEFKEGLNILKFKLVSTNPNVF